MTNNQKITRVFHASPVPNLKVLEPRVSTHGVPYVYGTEMFALTLLFGTSKSFRDLDGVYGAYTDYDNGKVMPTFHEAYPGAFARRFKGESCYTYEVEPDTFVRGKTGWRAEVVSEVPVKVIGCTKIDDTYETLMQLEKEGQFIFKEYNNDPNVKERLLRMLCHLNKKNNAYKYFQENFPDLIEEAEERNLQK